MSEYTELTAKIEALEKRVKYLEDTFATLADMNKSGEIGQYIAQRQRALAASKLVNAAAGTQKLNADAQQKVIDQLASEKAAMDAKIEEAIRASAQSAPAEDDLAEQFTYRDVPGGVEIQGIKKYIPEEELFVPEEINGKPVVSIGRAAFKNMKFKKAILPKWITCIKESAFENCSDLEVVKLPDALEVLEKACFASTNVRELVMPDGLQTIEDRCFNGCYQMEKAILNKQLMKIGLGAFSWTKIQRVIIPENVQIIEDSFNFGTTVVVLGLKTKLGESFPRKGTFIYCLAGSDILKNANEKGIPVKALSGI